MQLVTVTGAALLSILPITVLASVLHTPLQVRSHGSHFDDASLIERAAPANAPYGYTPHTSTCPSPAPYIRDASSLSTYETEWLSKRRSSILSPMKALLSRANFSSLNVDDYLDSLGQDHLPTIGIAISGGGYRAMLNGAGVLEAFDNRTPNSNSSGQVGGLLQSATYLAGLSGGSWLVGSLYANNFTSVSNIISTDTASQNVGGIWQFGNSIFDGPKTNGIQALSSAVYYADLVGEVTGKKLAGYSISITDFWGRALSFQLVNTTHGGRSYTFSSIASQDFFQSGSVPLPLIVSDSRASGELLVPDNTTIFTFSPWEIGSEDPSLHAFAPLKYFGTQFAGGNTSTSNCVTGYDNIGFVMGTSSSLFNELLTEVNGTSPGSVFSSALRDAILKVLADVGTSNVDVSLWKPNPFYGYNNSTNMYAQDTQLTLVDGGEDNQNIPLHPLIQNNRHVDVIFAVDSSADTNASLPTSHSAQNWPAGISMVATYQRSLSTMANGTSFPTIPDLNTFFNLGLNNKPAFFGCNISANATNPAPLIVYLPNAPYNYNSNVSTFDLKYSDTQRNALISNGYALATQGNGTLDSDWTSCVSCAILKRSLGRTGTAMPAICETCFGRYCWNGTIDSSQPANYQPTMKLS